MTQYPYPSIYLYIIVANGARFYVNVLFVFRFLSAIDDILS